MTTNIQKRLLLLFTLALAVTQTDATYLNGILRLYRGDQGFVDSTGNDPTALNLVPYPEGSSDHGISVVDDTPYGSSREVFDFTRKGSARGSASGLPGGAAPRTIIGWFKTTTGYPENTNHNGPFGYGVGDCNSAYWFLFHFGVMDLVQWCYVTGDLGRAIQPVVVNQWYHIAGTWNGTHNSIYVDGALVASGEPDTLPATIVDPNLGGTVVIGGSPYNSPDYNYSFEGRVADFAIFDRALTLSEVSEIYNDPSGVQGTPPQSAPSVDNTPPQSAPSVDNPPPQSAPSVDNPPSAGSPPKEGEWFIYNAGDATEKAISAKEIEISLPFNTSNRDRGANVYESDCVTALNNSDALVTNLHTTTPTSDADDGFIQFNTTFVVDIDAFNETDYLTPFEDGERGGRVELCIETFLEFNDMLDLGNGIANERVNFKNNVLNISISLTSDFTVDSVNVEREEVDTENVETDYSEFVNAFLCDSSQSEIQQSDITYKQGQRIRLCVSDTPNDDNNRIVQVEEFDSLVVSQDSLSPYNFIKNSLFNPEITTPACVDGTGGNRRVCYVDFVALPRFFAEADPSDLTISGSVFVVRDGSRVRRSLRMAPPASEDNNAENALAVSGRRAQAEGEEGSGDFEVFASLESTADSAAPGLTTAAAGLVSMAVGAAGEALMA